jgi:hypothetical protein
VPQELIICTLCLRVQHDSHWIDAERVIREIRSYELETVPRLHGSICDNCVDSILRRRGQNEQTLAA